MPRDHHLYEIKLPDHPRHDEIDVGTNNAEKKVYDTFSIGWMRRVVHAWSGSDPCCKCVELTGQCPLPLYFPLTILPAARGKTYKIGTTRPPSTGEILGTYGTLVVGSGGRGGGDDGDPDCDR